MNKNKPLSIKVMPLEQLKAAPYNPRSISKEALTGLKASVKRFGLVEPIVWNRRTKHVVGGHQRIKALSEMGHDEAQVVVVDLPVREEKALNLALNNPHIAGEFTDGVAEMVSEIGREAMELVEELRLGNLVVGVPEAPSFEPGLLDDQGRLDEVAPKIIRCPHCGEEFDIREQN